MDQFEVPAIPKIFVPKPISKPETQNHPNSSKNPSNNEDLKKSSEQQISCTEDNKKDASPPQLCASCSQILLSYFMPLQQYVNEVIQMAQGDRVATPRPLFNLLNSEVIKSQIESSFSGEIKDGNNLANNSNKQTERENRHFNEEYHESEKNLKKVQVHGSGYTRNESNYNRNQNQNYSQNPNYSQNQSHNQNQNYDQNQSFNKTENYSQNVSQTSTQTNESTNVSQKEDQTITRINREERVESPESTYSRPDGNREESGVQRVTDHKSPETGDQQNYIPNTNEGTVQTFSDEAYESRSAPHPESNVNKWSESVVGEEDNSMTISSPFAFVTIAYNNLSATNAIILANSLLLTNNKSMNVMDKNGNKNIINIPLIILIGGNIDPVLKEAIYMVFDEVIIP